MVHQLLVLKGLKDQKDPVEGKGHKELKVHKEPRDYHQLGLKELKELEDLQVLKGLPEELVSVLRVLKVLKEQKDHHQMLDIKLMLHPCLILDKRLLI